MLFNEKNIPRLIILTPIVTIIVLTFSITYFVISSQYSYFEKQSIVLEKEYIKKQKDLLVSEVNNVIKYIDYHRKKFNNIDIHELQEKLRHYIDTLRYGDNGYIWIHNTDYYLISHPYRKESIGTYDINLRDESGKYITRAFVTIATKKPEGDFLIYYWKKPKTKKVEKKLGFVKLYTPWKWVIGSGLYMDDISKSIKKQKEQLENQIQNQIKIIITIAVFFTFITGLISYMISKNIINSLKKYKDEVIQNELSLKSKIEEAIKDAQIKDRAMMYQSRLAQMGEMISMIAHQWKQPLSEISGIFMELETACRFNKLDKDYLLDLAKDGDNISCFMSKTIENFRNFFKPDKVREVFSINKASKEALSLVEATMKNSNITVHFLEKEDVKIEGYPNEYSQVVLNILTNARDALVQRSVANPEITIKIFKENGKSILEIYDNAGGISDVIIEKIFDPYFTTKKEPNGTGLGLYMSKMIIEKSMNGKLNVANHSNGALFRIEI